MKMGEGRGMGIPKVENVPHVVKQCPIFLGLKQLIKFIVTLAVILFAITPHV